MKPFITFLILGFSLILAGCGSTQVVITEDNISREELILAHNKERMTKGIGQMQLDTELTERAQKWAEWMARNNRLKHGSLSGSSFNYVGENIAMGYGDIETVMNGWMNSTGHRKNILNKNYTHAGFGYARLQNGQPYWCAQFGGR